VIIIAIIVMAAAMAKENKSCIINTKHENIKGINLIIVS
jgi:hypothetical protein